MPREHPVPMPCPSHAHVRGAKAPFPSEAQAKGTRTMRTLMRSGHLRAPTWIRPHHTPPWRAISYGHAIGVMRRPTRARRNRPNRARRAAAIAASRAFGRKPGRTMDYEPGLRYGEEPGSVSDLDSYKYRSHVYHTSQPLPSIYYRLFSADSALRSVSDTRGAARARPPRPPRASGPPRCPPASRGPRFRPFGGRCGNGKRAAGWARDPKANGTVGSREEVLTRPLPLPPAASHRSRHGTRTTRIKGRHSISHGDGGPTSG